MLAARLRAVHYQGGGGERANGRISNNNSRAFIFWLALAGWKSPLFRHEARRR
jgi:hypothetical protein